MQQLYRRFINGIEIKMGKYSDYDFVVIAGYRLFAEVDNIADAYREYNAIDASALAYMQ